MEDESVDLKVAVRALSDPDVLMERIVGEALRLIPSADGSAIQLMDHEFLRFAHMAGNLDAFPGFRVPAAASLSGLTLRTGTILRCEDSETDPRVDREACHRVGVRSMVCVPLRSADKPVGVLSLTARQPEAFSDRDVATLAGLSTFLTAALTAMANLGGAMNEVLVVPTGQEAPDTSGLSAFIANVLRPGVVEDLEVAKRVQRVLAERSFFIVHQPIFDLDTGRATMFEALSRFIPEPVRSPDEWFHDAWRVGLGADLELATAAAALSELDLLPGGCRIAINFSPSLIEHPDLGGVLEPADPNRLVIEVTEHLDVEDFHRTRQILEPLRRRGVRIAMDDTGNGFSSLSRIIELGPDIIKLDHGMVRGIDVDPVRRSLASAIVNFSKDMTAIVVAEGIETEDELHTVRTLGIPCGQGYLLARPGPAELVSILTASHHESRRGQQFEPGIRL